MSWITATHLLWPAGLCSPTATPPSPAGLDTERACPESRCEAPPRALAPPSGRPCDLWPSPTESPGRRRRLGSATRWSDERASAAIPWRAESVPPQTGQPIVGGQEARWWGRREPPGWRGEGRGCCQWWCPGNQKRNVDLNHHLSLKQNRNWTFSQFPVALGVNWLSLIVNWLLKQIKSLHIFVSLMFQEFHLV